jgi:hypothetical protein
MGKYIVGMGSEMIDVYLNFFKKMNILKEELISDTYFIRFENGDSDMNFSIHKKEYDRVKVDLRDDKINLIIDN